MKRFVFLALVFIIFISNAHGDVYSPNRSLYTLETKFFHIIFPEESRSAAAYLATFADSSYDEIAGLLGTEKRYKISVVFTPDSEELNGSFTNYPYLRILLYQAAIDPDSGLGSFNNDLYKLFYHELTHAVSLTLRGPVQNILVAVFGTPLGISVYTTPLNFTEGITVSFESRDGFGRAADPLAGAILRQDIIEGNWKTFIQTAGAYDDVPGGNLYYLYGGYFSKMLQDRYGMEKYAKLWQALGSGLLSRPFDDWGYWPGHFSRVYGFTLETAWAELKSLMSIRVPVVMDVSPIREAAPITAICATPLFLYYADSAKKELLRYDPAAKIEAKVLDAFYASRLSASADGSKLLISTHKIEEGFPRLELREMDTASNKVRVLPYRKLRDASYTAAQDIVAIRMDGYQTDIVLAGASGIKVLLEGSERIAYSNPLVSADGLWLYALARIDGTNSLVRVNLNGSSQIQRLETPVGIGWLRYLSQSEGILRMGWDDDKLYRLAEIEGDTVRWQTTPISGGVHDPVAVKSEVFYLAHFSNGIAPCLFPQNRDQLGMTEAPARWLPADELLAPKSAYDSPPASGEKKYNEAFWMLSRFWHPTLNGDLENGISSLGIAFYMQDPIDRLDAQVWAGWNTLSSLPQWSIEVGINAWAYPISLNASDSFTVLPVADPGDLVSVLRSSSAGASVSGAWQTFAGSEISWILGTGAFAYSTSSGSAGMAYAYRFWDSINLTATGALGIGNFKYGTNDPDYALGYRFILLSRNLAALFPSSAYGLSSGLETSLAFKATPLELNVFGAFAPLGQMVYNSSGFFLPNSGGSLGGSASYPTYAGFAGKKSGTWYAQGEAKLRIIHASIQSGAGGAYANRLYLEAGARGALATPGTWHMDASAPDYAATGFGRLTLTWTPAFGMAAQIHPQSWIEIWINPETGKYGIDFSIIAEY